MTKLSEKIAIVTGASSGIGEATAMALAAEGAKVALLARREERLKTLKETIATQGGQAISNVLWCADLELQYL